MKILIILLNFNLICIFTLAQNLPINIGNLTMDEFSLAGIDVDTSASAVIMMDFGKASFEFTGIRFQYKLEVVSRKKILNKNGLDGANIFIPINWSKSGAKDAIKLVKGYTYNLKNGALNKTRLEKSSTFIESTTENLRQYKIAFPDVKVGSVIEYHYVLISPFLGNLPPWYFQNTIPVIHSEFYLSVPEYLDYQLFPSGYLSFNINEKSSSTRQLPQSSGLRTRASDPASYTKTQSYNVDNYHWVLENAPAFKAESFISAPTNYITKMEFEIRGIRGLDHIYHPIFGSWEQLTKTYLESYSFGKLLDNHGFLSSDISSMTFESENDKIMKITDMVRNKLEWNGWSSDFASHPLKKTWEKGKGNSADINLLLIAALREAGVDADPVLLSTREHGFIKENFAVAKQFNYVIARVIYDNDKTMLLDATDRFIPTGILPVRCLNGRGWLVVKHGGQWIDLMPNKTSSTSFSCNMSLNQSTTSGNIKIQFNGYPSYKLKKEYQDIGEDQFIDSVKEKHKDWDIHNYQISGLKSVKQPLAISYDLSIDDEVVSNGNVIFLDPMLGQGLHENPFKMDERKYPVDYAFPKKEVYLLKIDYPEDFIIDELPSPIATMMPDHTGKFSYNVTAKDHTISVTSIYEINKSVFGQTEYAALKQFHQIIVDKQAEQVVLKKRTE